MAVTKGKIGDIVFQFNPETIDDSIGGRIRSILQSANAEPLIISTGKNKRVLTMELIFTEGYDAKIGLAQIVAKLREYAQSAQPVNAVLGAFFAGKVIVDLPNGMTVEKFYTDLKEKAIRVTVQLTVD